MEGNKVINFVVSEKDVRDRIAMNSYYRGERVKNGERENAAIMQSGDDNADLLNDELQIAEHTVMGLISRNLGLCNINKEGDNCTFTVKAVSNFPEDLKSAIEGAITNFLHDKVLEGWLLVTMPQEVSNLRDRFLLDQEQLVRLLLERRKPLRN